jgi:DNA polymerase III epsilon subunit-like protein
MIDQNIVVLDLETSSSRRSDCEIVQIGALVINPANLAIVVGSEFVLDFKVLDESKIDDGALAVSGKTREDVSQGVDPSEGWHRFTKWCSQWNIGGKNDVYSTPIPAGHNIIRFDLPILERYSHRYNTTRSLPNGETESSLYSGLYRYDTLLILATWGEGNPEFPKLGMDALRKYMEIPSGDRHAHDALQDVRDTAAILIKLLRLHRRESPKVIWKSAFDAKKVEAEIARRQEQREKKAEKVAARQVATEQRQRYKRIRKDQ